MSYGGMSCKVRQAEVHLANITYTIFAHREREGRSPSQKTPRLAGALCAHLRVSEKREPLSIFFFLFFRLNASPIDTCNQVDYWDKVKEQEPHIDSRIA